MGKSLTLRQFTYTLRSRLRSRTVDTHWGGTQDLEYKYFPDPHRIFTERFWLLRKTQTPSAPAEESSPVVPVVLGIGGFICCVPIGIVALSYLCRRGGIHVKKTKIHKVVPEESIAPDEQEKVDAQRKQMQQSDDILDLE